MTVEFDLLYKDSNAVSQIVKDLKAKGYALGVDFDFAYIHTQWSSEHGVTAKKTKFTFYNEKLGTWFILRWS